VLKYSQDINKPNVDYAKTLESLAHAKEMVAKTISKIRTMNRLKKA
jgi:hypothetical protein